MITKDALSEIDIKIHIHLELKKMSIKLATCELKHDHQTNA